MDHLKFGGAFLVAGLISSGNSIAQERPNVILIVTDDMGVGDLSFNTHQEIAHSPNIDKLAYQGVICTQGYASASMSLPSRVGLLTGRYPARCGAYKVNTLQGLPANNELISTCLKREGYTTGLFGKWHVGGEFQDWQLPENNHFDRTFYWIDSTHDYWKADTGRTNTWGEVGHAPIYDQGVEIENYETGYLTTDIAKRSLEFVKNNADKPFFMYVAHHCVHVPLQVSEEIYNRYREFDYDKNTTVTRGMINVLDDYIGELLTTLDKLQISNNTLIILTSDNGGGEPDGQLNDISRGGKFTLLEGGIRVPFLIRWPATLPSNVVYCNPVINIDLMPTIVEAAGAKLTNSIDGVSLLPFLKGENENQPHDVLYWSSGVKRNDDFAIRSGSWKLVSTINGVGLFNLSNDPMETIDLRESYPDIYEKLKTLYDIWETDNIIQKIPKQALEQWHNARDSVKTLNIRYNYSSTFGNNK